MSLVRKQNLNEFICGCLYAQVYKLRYGIVLMENKIYKERNKRSVLRRQG